jgi:multiple sugar transport system permease protein
MVPAITYFVPQFVTITDVPGLGISLVNTWWAIWLPGITSPVVILLFKQFFDQLPDELFEAAEVDGAGSFRVLVQIVIPLARPVIGVASIYTFIAVWQDFLWPLLTLPDNRRWPLEVAIYKLQAGSVPLNVQMAGMVIATIPMVVICMIFQRQIISGIAMSEGK